MGQFFASGGQSIEVSASASVLPVIFRTDFLEDWLVGSPCCPWDSQESSPTPQFKSTDSLGLSFLYGPTLTCVHDYWKNHNSDSIDLLSAKWCLCLLILCLGHSFPSKKQASFNFMAAVTVCSAFQFSCSVVSDSLRPHGLQYARLPSQEFREGIQRTEKERDEVMADGGLRTHITFISYIYCLI